MKKKKKKSKKKLVVDRHAPKRPISPYLYFIKEKTPEYKENHPELTHKQVISKLAELWSGFSIKDKLIVSKK